MYGLIKNLNLSILQQISSKCVESLKYTNKSTLFNVEILKLNLIKINLKLYFLIVLPSCIFTRKTASRTALR